MNIELIISEGLNTVKANGETVAECFSIKSAAEIIKTIADAEKACTSAQIDLHLTNKNKDNQENVYERTEKNES